MNIDATTNTTNAVATRMTNVHFGAAHLRGDGTIILKNQILVTDLIVRTDKYKYAYDHATSCMRISPAPTNANAAAVEFSYDGEFWWATRMDTPVGPFAFQLDWYQGCDQHVFFNWINIDEKAWGNDGFYRVGPRFHEFGALRLMERGRIVLGDQYQLRGEFHELKFANLMVRQHRRVAANDQLVLECVDTTDGRNRYFLFDGEFWHQATIEGIGALPKPQSWVRKISWNIFYLILALILLGL